MLVSLEFTLYCKPFIYFHANTIRNYDKRIDKFNQLRKGHLFVSQFPKFSFEC